MPGSDDGVATKKTIAWRSHRDDLVDDEKEEFTKNLPRVEAILLEPLV